MDVSYDFLSITTHTPNNVDFKLGYKSNDYLVQIPQKIYCMETIENVFLGDSCNIGAGKSGNIYKWGKMAFNKYPPITNDIPQIILTDKEAFYILTSRNYTYVLKGKGDLWKLRYEN